MVRLSVRLRALADQTRSIEHALGMLMRATRLEPGCMGCQVWTRRVDGDPERVEVHYEERWASEAAMERRVREDSFTRVLEVLEGALETPWVEFDFISRQQGLEYVAGVRGARDR